MAAAKRVFMVDGKPFFPIGSEFLNMSGYSRPQAEGAL